VSIFESDEICARRKRVECVMELYVFLEDNPLSVKLNSALLAEIKSMRFGSAGDLHSWKMTVGLILATMRRACGQCRPMVAFQRLATCIHAEQLERAARLKNAGDNDHHLISDYEAQLGSHTRRRRMNQKHLARAQFERVAARQRIDAAGNERRSIVHRASYAEAIELFDRNVRLSGHRTREEVFREGD
jgi:hypothetical protein